MTISRRRVLRGSALATLSTLAAPVWAARPVPVLIVFDSARLAPPVSGGAALLDIAQDRRAQWRALRGVRPAGRVLGLTGWSDYLQCHDCLREQGLRLTACVEQIPLRAPLQAPLQAPLFRWEMVPAGEVA